MNTNLRETASQNIVSLQEKLKELPKSLKAMQAQHKEKRDALMKEAGILEAVENLDSQMEDYFKQLQSSADQLQGQLQAWTEVAAALVAEENEVANDVASAPEPEDEEEEEDGEAEPEIIHGIDVSRLDLATRMQVLAGNPETIAILKGLQDGEEEKDDEGEWDDEGEDLLDQMDEVDAILDGVRVAPESDEENDEPDEFDVDDFFGDEGEEGSPVEALVERYRSDRPTS